MPTASRLTWGFLHIPAKRCNPGFPLPLLSVFLDRMQVGEVQIKGGGTEPLMAENLLNGGLSEAGFPRRLATRQPLRALPVP
jgi:hypothetical protein